MKYLGFAERQYFITATLDSKESTRHLEQIPCAFIFCYYNNSSYYYPFIHTDIFCFSQHLSFPILFYT